MRKIVFSLYIILSSLFVLDAVAEEQLLIKKLHDLFPDIDITSIDKTPIDNLYQVLIGTDVIYMTSDAQFVLKGDLINIDVRSNLSEISRSHARAELLKTVGQNEYIEFSAENSQDIIYAFTDVDCGYCQKLHKDVAELNANAITVRYLAYPRSGVASPTYKKMVSIWCSENRQQALTDAKNGLRVEEKDCANTVAQQHALGGQLGIRGTPAIFLENGTLFPGYVEPSAMLKKLGR